MGPVSQKISSGLIELGTDIGPVYANPSFCERIYLLWIFRNFRRLPVQVLNPRQRQLIQRLCQAAALSQHGPTVRTRIIGVVENVYLMPDRKAELAANTSKILKMSTTSVHVDMPRAVGSEENSSTFARLTYSRPGTGRFTRSTANVKSISALTQHSAHKKEPRKANRVLVAPDVGDRWPQNWPKWALVAAFAAALFGSVFYFGYAVPVPPAVAPQVADQAHYPGSTEVPSTAVSQPAPEQPVRSLPSEHMYSDAVNVGKPLAPPAIAARQGVSKQGNAVILTEPPAVAINATAAERVLIAAAPLTFRYPVAPNPVLTGKVNLKLEIGTDGAVRQVDVLSGNRTLADAAVRAVRHWRYRPPELNGHAVEAETNITISFVGDDAVSINFLH